MSERNPMPPWPTNCGCERSRERGITLVEVVIVGVLASLVMLALSGFYISSQGSWIESSSQAVTQREVSLVLETLSDSTRASNSALLTSSPKGVTLYDSGGKERCWFRLATDSRIHMGRGTTDWGPMATSTVTRFDLEVTPRYVKVLTLEMKSANGRLIPMSTLAAFYNR